MEAWQETMKLEGRFSRHQKLGGAGDSQTQGELRQDGWNLQEFLPTRTGWGRTWNYIEGREESQEGRCWTREEMWAGLERQDWGGG